MARQWWRKKSPKACSREFTAHLPRRDVFVRATIRKMKRENSDDTPSE